MEKEVVGSPELELIQQALAVRFGTIVSLASIARTLADHGVPLGHPAILAADLLWRERTSLFTQEDLSFGSLESASALIEKIEGLRGTHALIEEQTFQLHFNKLQNNLRN